MEYRVATEADRIAVGMIWKRTFHDSEAFIEQCLDAFAGQGNVYVAQDGPFVQAILLCVPCALAGVPGVYMYALATEPEYRGKGVMTELMQVAESHVALSGAMFSVLIPEGGPLFGYYRKRGYTQDILLRHIEIPVEGIEAKPAKGVLVDAVHLAALRQRFMHLPVVGFSQQRSMFIAQDMKSAGIMMAESEDAYAVYLKPEGVEEAGRLYIAELCAVNDEAAKGLVATVTKYLGCAVARITLPWQSPLFAGKGIVRPAGLLKALRRGFDAQGAYMRFALDPVEKSF